MLKSVLKKITTTLIIIFVLACIIFFFPQTDFSNLSKDILINKSNTNEVANELTNAECLKSPILFKILAFFMLESKNIKMGKYKFYKNEPNFSIIKKIKYGQYVHFNYTFIKYRTKEQFAIDINKQFNVSYLDVINYISNNDSLKEFEVDTNYFFTIIIPNTYTFNWNTNIKSILKKMNKYTIQFKKENPINNIIIKKLNLTFSQIYILASIIEEESNNEEDKKLIASVYLNRIKNKIPLQADPTIKFALQDFSLKRIYKKYLKIKSPYNTYINKGLPIGPICTPSISTLKIVLNAPITDYIYFVAKADFSGTHQFSKTYKEHIEKARIYHNFLDSLQKSR